MDHKGPDSAERDEARELVDAARLLLRPHLERSPALRRLVGALGELLRAEAARAGRLAENHADGPPQQRPEPADDRTGPASPASELGPAAPPPNAPSVIVPLRLGDAHASVAVQGTPGHIPDTAAPREQGREPPEPGVEARAPDLSLLAARAALKAEACRTYIRRRAAEPGSDEDATMVAEVQRLLDRARTMTGCFLWMLYREHTQPDDPTLELIARWYAALGRAAAIAARLGESLSARRPDIEHGMQLLAWAGAGLRPLLERTWLTKPDTDQDDAHTWLRRETQARAVLLRRYMRLDDPASPDSIGGLEAELTTLERSLDQRERAASETKQLLRRVQYHADLLATDRSHNTRHDWDRIESALESLAALGADPDAVAAALEELADAEAEPPASCPRAAGALGEARTMVAQTETDEHPGVRQWSGRVAQARALLEGRGLVVIGGERRIDAIDRLTDAFGLDGVEWVELTEHGTGASMRAPIQRAGTALVLVLVKLTGHLHAEEARRHAKAAGKPLVLLKAGYNPERVAIAVLSQASGQLAGA